MSANRGVILHFKLAICTCDSDHMVSVHYLEKDTLDFQSAAVDFQAISAQQHLTPALRIF